MDLVLKFLINQLNTIDGWRDSAQHFKKVLLRNDLAKYKVSSLEKQREMMSRIDKNVLYRTLFAYKLIRIRNKISFCCLYKRKTVTELFLSQMLNSYGRFFPQHKIQLEKLYEQIKDAHFDSVISTFGLLQQINKTLVESGISKYNEVILYDQKIEPAQRFHKTAMELLGLK